MSIREFQDMMRRIYFQRDFRRGTCETFKWLKDEVDELGTAMLKADEKALEDEFADVIAWLASLANLLNVDLEKSASGKYPGHCPKCGSSPCQCPFREKKD